MRDIAATLLDLESSGLKRRRRLLDSAQGPQVRIDGAPKLSFSSNDYLGLAGDPRITEALCEGARQWGAGAGASHLVTGHQRVHEELELRLAAFVGLPRALLFSSGYLANLAIVTTLATPSCEIFADRLNHASLNDAMLLSRVRFRRYPHCDLDALERQLAQSTAPEKMVVTDAVFSMDGDIAPLDRLLELCERHDAMLVVDDAHGFGVLGKDGAGSLSHFQVDSPRVVYMGTLGKAAGVAGAFVAAVDPVIELLIQQARPYIYTTAGPPAVAFALIRSLELMAQESWRRERLVQLSRQLAALLKTSPWRLLCSTTPIQPLVVGKNREALALSDSLAASGILVPAIRPPTVPEGTARLRISLSAAHSEQDVLRLVEALRDAQDAIPSEAGS
ncbi:MAG TPA: 8-amino-7-oxononanoate synthase [Burkholderiales bacterium]|nr:8-amino-7-oxononanoate synthase [Burkholderiales bacterium]